jgi:CheY-like chemotaxis protein
MIILDLILPSMDGFDVIKRLKNDPETAGIPILVITGNAVADKEKAMTLGAREYLIKPFSMKKLYEELDKILDKEMKDHGEKKDTPGG